MIRDATVPDPDGPPAIMMGDFNIHSNKYGIMNALFRKVGAVDAYVAARGSDVDGATLNWYLNVLHRYFWPTNEDTDFSTLVSRIDYVYVKQSGNGFWLEPTNAYVRRNWKIQPPGNYEDVSDHYPVFVEFRLQEESRLEIRPGVGEWRLNTQGRVGRRCEIQQSSDLLTWEKLVEFRMTNSPHLYIDSESPIAQSRFYRLLLK